MMNSDPPHNIITDEYTLQQYGQEQVVVKESLKDISILCKQCEKAIVSIIYTCKNPCKK